MSNFKLNPKFKFWKFYIENMQSFWISNIKVNPTFKSFESNIQIFWMFNTEYQTQSTIVFFLNI